MSTYGNFKAHYWTVTQERDAINDEFIHHHVCQRCGAMKDIPNKVVYNYGRTGKWK